MTARAVFSEARLLRLLAVAREQGLQPTAVRVERDGAIEMTFGGAPAAPVEAGGTGRDRIVNVAAAGKLATCNDPAPDALRPTEEAP